MTATAWEEKLEKYVKENGLRLTHQRRMIAQTFFESEGHLDLNQLHGLVQQREPGIGLATLYRTVRLLVDSGLASGSRLGGPAARYESALDDEHHDHLICVECGRIVEFCDDQIESRQDQIAREHGFRIVDHKMELYGVCLEGCADKPQGG